jgi:hypothetical protein
LIAFRLPPIGPDKAAFRRYLSDFGSVEDEQSLLASLGDRDDLLPVKYAALLFLPPAATYRDAVRLLVSSWIPNETLR